MGVLEGTDVIIDMLCSLAVTTICLMKADFDQGSSMQCF